MKKKWQSAWLLPLLLLASSITAQATTNVHIDGDFTVTGDTGLGTTSPDAKLEVVGDILADGYVYSETTDRKVFAFNNGAGWYRIIDSWAFGPGLWTLAGKIRIIGFTQQNRGGECEIHLTGGGPWAANNGINIVRASSYLGGDLHKIRIGYKSNYNLVVDVYKAYGGGTTGIVDLVGADSLRLQTTPVYNPTNSLSNVLEKNLRVLGIAHQQSNQSFGIGGSKVGVGTEIPTAKLHVIGNIIADNPTQTNHVATKSYVDTEVTGASSVYVSLDGSASMTGSLDFNESNVENVDELTVNQVIITGTGIISQGGDARGANAVDLQTVRDGTWQVASGEHSVVGGGLYNAAQGSRATVAGGIRNQASATASTVSGGHYNSVNGRFSSIVGGNQNLVSGEKSIIAGGGDNEVSGDYASIVGGNQNISGGYISTVVGGYLNEASGWGSFVGGGERNESSGGYSAIPGGVNNNAQGWGAFIGGGFDNTAVGSYSFAAGRRAKANHQGAFVWADSKDADFASTGVDQFLVKADGGVGIGTTSPTAQLHVDGDAKFEDAVYLLTPQGDISMGSYTNGLP